jgi:hypothetical protein
VTPAHRFEFPNGKQFAFTIIDDTDDGTVENLTPMYRLLEELDMRATKTVWPMPCPEGSRTFFAGTTLEDPEYRAFVIDLARRGFEITWHGATMEPSLRERTIAGLERYREIFGEYPRIHANHASNRENLYWGAGRLDSTILRGVLGRRDGFRAEFYGGHTPDSPYWWGDLSSTHFTYARNLTTTDIDTARFNPSMPYRDPRRPLIPWWFSASDAEDVNEFNALIAPEHQERLERYGGFCVVATHFGKRFAKGGELNPITRERLTALARRDGWFPSVGELLDWLRARRQDAGATDGRLPRSEWRRMQWRWGVDRALHTVRRRLGR